MLLIRTSGQQKRNMQHQLMANDQWLIATSSLSHPDSNRRYRNFTDSVLLVLRYYLSAPSRSRGLSPPVGNFTLPRVFYYKDREKNWIMQLFLRWTCGLGVAHIRQVCSALLALSALK